MDFFQKLFGAKEPTLIVAQSPRWTTLASSPELDRLMTKRAAKEKWTEAEGHEHAFHCLLRLLGDFSTGVLELESLGERIAIIDHERAVETLEKMRADNGLRVTAVAAFAQVDGSGHWTVTVNI